MKQVSNSQKVAKGISSQTLVTAVLGVVEIVSFSIMSRLLTKADFGYYAAITAVVAIFACFSNTGIGSAIIQRKELTKNYVNNAFTLSFIVGSFVSLLLFSLSGILANTIADESMTVPLMIMSVTLLFNCLTSVNTSIMHRRLQFLQVGMINLVSLVVTTIVAVFLAIEGYGYYAIITKGILGSILTYILSFICAKTRYGIALDKQTFQQIFGFSGWLMASGLFRNLAHNIDRLVFSNLLSVESLGAYNRPKDFISKISVQLNGIFDIALFPVLSSIQDDKVKVRNAFNRSLYLINIFAMLLTLAIAVNSELIVRIFFGEKWMELRWVLMILSLLMLFNIDGRLADCFLRSLGMTKQQFFFRVMETVVTLIGVIIGSHWDIFGVAFGVVLTNMLLKLIKILYISYKINVTFSSVVWEILGSWKFAVFLIPICFFTDKMIPNTITGNILVLVVFVSITLFLFLVSPSLVGEQYKKDVYLKISDKLKVLSNRLKK